MRFFLVVFSVICLTGCMNQKSRQFKNYLIGDWTIENPTLQSFIRFEENGKTIYFMNRYSYQLDSLAQIGKWSLDEIRKGKYTDTFMVSIDKQPQKTIFQLIAIDHDKIKVIDEQGQTYFTRIQKN
ncbi:MAG: hypothetical protein CBC39_00495 [Cellvibrionales bacterium TMED79]|nr:MAG: hypothetical protein CBC39_00495 [Cellvibrionales bacterium TMED79]|tara:strand:- start:2009 stop:2386 length:378 start_codon:yes stop_codon:yes gene_type:complete